MRKLRASELHADDAVRVIAIEAVRCDAKKSAGLYRLFARIEATAIVVCAAEETRFVGLASAETSLEELQRKVPGLRDLLVAPRVRQEAADAPEPAVVSRSTRSRDSPI